VFAFGRLLRGDGSGESHAAINMVKMQNGVFGAVADSRSLRGRYFDQEDYHEGAKGTKSHEGEQILLPGFQNEKFFVFLRLFVTSW